MPRKPSREEGVDVAYRRQHPPDEAKLAWTAGRQQGLITREQLIGLDFSAGQIARRLRRNRLFLIERNVYAVGHSRVSPRTRLLAVELSLGPDGFLSHRCAPAALGLRPVDLRAIEVTVPGSGGRRRAGLIIHRCIDPPPVDELRSTHDGLRHSSMLRLLVELAGRETSQELARLITLGVQRRLLRLDASDGRAAVETVLGRHAGCRGMRTLTAVLNAYRSAGNSNLEVAFSALLARHPEIPQPIRNVTLGPWEIDALWPAQRVAVELDGRPYHTAVAEMERDRRKDIDLQRRGLRPLRFTDWRLQTDEAGILGDVRHFVCRAGT